MNQLIITKDFQKQIDILHRSVGNTEWSGVLFYQLTHDITDDRCQIIPKYIYPMDVGTSAATEFDYSEELLVAYDLFPDAMDCKEGIIHTHHTMGAFFSGTDTKELETNAKNYDFYLSLVVDFQRTYKAKIAIAPTSAIAVVNRNQTSFQIEYKHQIPVISFDLDVIYEEDDEPVYSPINDRIKELIQLNKKKSETKTPPALGYVPSFVNEKSSYETEQIEKNRRNKKSNSYGGAELPFQRMVRKDPPIPSTIMEIDTIGIEKHTERYQIYLMLIRWIADDFDYQKGLKQAITELSARELAWDEIIDYMNLTFNEFLITHFPECDEEYIPIVTKIMRNYLKSLKDLSKKQSETVELIGEVLDVIDEESQCY